MSIADWVEEELATVDLKNKKRDRRLKRLVTDISAMPCASIPAAVGGGHAETAAAYRFFENPAVEFDAILAPHRHATLERIKQQKCVVIVQDTSEIDVTRPEEQVQDAGPLDAGARRGCLLHPSVAFTQEGIPLGTVAADCWTREDVPEEDRPKTKAERDKHRLKTPIEEKESIRWVEGIREAHKVAAFVPDVEVIAVADSEADIFEFLVEAQAVNGESNKPRAQWIVRSCFDRALHRDKNADDDTSKKLYEMAASSSVQSTYAVQIRGRDSKVACETRGRRQARESREAMVEVRACQVTLRAPSRPDRKLPHIQVNAVLVREIDPPPGETPIEWLLLTSLPISSVEEVLRVIQTYCIRWMIEIFFRVVKQGCRVEKRRFEYMDNAKRFLAVALLVSWRTLYVTRLGRDFPEMSCEAVFTASEWKSVYQITQKKRPPKKAPKLQEMVRMVAQLGGYVNRARKDEPGAETIWKGLQRMHDMALCWDMFGGGKDVPTKCSV